MAGIKKAIALALAGVCVVALTSGDSVVLPFLESDLPESRADEMVTEFVE